MGLFITICKYSNWVKMMDEGFLTKISALGFVICILILYVMSTMDFHARVKLGEIDRSFIGKTVNVTGEINSVYVNEGNVFFTLSDETGEIKVVLWEDMIELIGINVSEINDGKTANVIGNVELYKGELEILPIRGLVKITE